MHALDHQLHIVEVGTGGGEAGAGLDVVGTGLADDVAHLFLLLLGQQTSLNDDLQNLIAHSLLHGTDILADSIVLLVLQAADVDDHIHLGCAVGDGSLGFKSLAGGIHSTQREAYHAAHGDAACHILHSLLDVAGVDADRCGVVCNGFVTQLLDLGPGSLRLQQGMIDMGQDLFAIHSRSSVILLAGTAHLCHAHSAQCDRSHRCCCTNDAQHKTRDQECEPFQTTFHNTVPPENYCFFLKIMSLLNT